MAKKKTKLSLNRKANTVTLGGLRLYNIHPEKDCEGRPCVIHNPVRDHMSDWELIWRQDRNIFERICPHGVGHPDKNQYPYWEETKQLWQAVHGCCGCCKEPQSE